MREICAKAKQRALEQRKRPSQPPPPRLAGGAPRPDNARRHGRGKVAGPQRDRSKGIALETPSRPPHTAATQLSLLGRLTLLRGGEDASKRIKYRKGYALLGYLAVHAGQWQPRERLARLLWPDLETESARNNLRQVLYNLSTLFDAGAASPLQKDGRAIRLQPGDGLSLDLHWLDDATLDRLGGGKADAAWREQLEATAPDLLGEFLHGLQLDDSPELDDWLHTSRHHFHARAALLLQRLCEIRQREGRLDAAIALARQLHRAAPLDENHALLLMKLLAEGGEQAAALAVFDTLRQRLAVELGGRPGPALQALKALLARNIRPDSQPEQRWLSVLYCAPGSRGAEDWAEDEQLLAEMQLRVERRGGQVLSVCGRGMLALFGATGERSSERALLAAADIHKGAAAGFAPRSGISAGKALLQPAAPRPRLLGPLPDLAMLAGWSAAPGEILVTTAVADEAGQGFRFEHAGAHRLPGFDAPQTFHRCGQALAPLLPEGSDAPFAGRDQELEILQGLWREAQTGQPRVALLRGPAGLGKTRLASELARRVWQQGGQVRRLACGLELQHRPLGPLIASLEAFAQLDEATPAGQRRGLLAAALRRAHPALDTEAVEAIAALVEQGNGKDAPPPKEDAFHALSRLLAAFADSPTLLIVDDLHWSDRATLELLQLLLPELGRQPLLLVLTARPDTELPTAAPAQHTLDLAPLPPAAALALIARHDPAQHIPPAERQRIADACGGVPLFLERLALTWHEGGRHSQTVAELLQNELDRLGKAKPVLMAAAVLGQRFGRQQLGALLPDTATVPALDAALDSRLIAEEDADSFVFRHALIRDAAYGSLAPARRRQLHRQVAELLCRHDKPAAENVAGHFAAAECWREAEQWWSRAGEAAMTQEFAADAMRCFEEALACVARLGRGEQDGERAMELRMRLGYAAQQAQGFGSPLAHRLFSEVALRLEAENSSDRRRGRLFAALSGRYMGGSSQGEVEGLDIARRLEKLAQTDAERLMAAFALGNSLFWRGQLQEAHGWQQRGIELAGRLGARDRVRYCVDDPAVTCRAFLGWNQWFLGDDAAACATAGEAVALARQGRRAHALCFALTFAVALHWCRQDRAEVLRLAAEAHALAARHGFSLWEGVNSLFLLWADAAGDTPTASALLFAAAERMRLAYQAGITTSRWIVAHALLAQAASEEAAQLLDLAIREADVNEDQYCLADLLWLKADCSRGEAEATALRQQALALARSQGAAGLLRRFTVSLQQGQNPLPASPAIPAIAAFPHHPGNGSMPP